MTLEEKIQKSDFGTEDCFLIFVFFVIDDRKYLAKFVDRGIEVRIMIKSLKGKKYGG